MCNPHILAIPLPAQGHVGPLMVLSQCLVKYGCRVTFVNSEYNNQRVRNSLEEKNCISDQLHLVSIPDGMEPEEDRNDFGKLTQAILRVMPGKLEELIQDINSQEGNKITCVIADGSMGWAIRVAEKMKIRKAAFWPVAASVLALTFSIPKLINDGTLDNDGSLVNQQKMVQLAPTMPSMNTENFVWTSMRELGSQKVIFEYMIKINECLKFADWTICNTSFDLEPGALTLYPKICPIGPLLASNRLGDSVGNFWPEDSTCLKWLDQKPPNSVIYVAFGSIAKFNQIQFQELALGLELSNMPFLWVVRPDTNASYPEGFQDRVGTRGKMVGWAPQQKVLSHPSIAGFLSHCGWNSTLEGVSNGVPFLCYPYFGDQFLDEAYICDHWKVGLKFNKNKRGIITREEVKDKVDQLLCDESFKIRAVKLMETAVNSAKEGGQSYQNFQDFLKWVKA